jgi:endonuclease/exonuclease/phosphatase family metal-dependent hydrolase
MRLLTANLYNGRADCRSLAELIDRVRPDVVATQEMAPDASEVIAARLTHGRLDPAVDHSGLGLASRRPMDVTRQPLPHRDAMVGRLDDLTIWSVHLANPVGFPPPLGARRAQIEALAGHLAGADRKVVVGDFNATPIWPAYRRLTRDTLVDGLAEWSRRMGTRPARTWGYRPWLPAVLRIDHVLVAGVEVTNALVEQVAGSDHRAVIVDLE